MAFVMMEVFWGLGQHEFFLASNHLEGYLKFAYMDWIQVFVTLCISKISICLFLLRISKFDKWRNFLFGIIAFLVLTHVPLTVLFVVQCRPVEAVWNMERQAECFSKETTEKIIIVQGCKALPPTAWAMHNLLIGPQHHCYSVLPVVSAMAN